MPLIDKSYFVGEINIPDTSNASVLERLNFLIVKYEGQLLRDLLGNALYAAYTTGIGAATPDAKWTELRDGKTYTDGNGDVQIWSGFRNSTTKQSLIANYVYYWWQRDKASHTTALGEVKDNTDGGERVSPIDKQVRAWNEMADQVAELVSFLNSNTTTYTEWTTPQSCKALSDYRYINAFNI
jgi:hypothetical protein